MTPDEIAAFLEPPINSVLTTLDLDGWPHSTAMWFVPDGDSVLMWTYGKSQKAVNVARDPRCAFLVETGTLYNELRGILVRANAEVLDDFDGIRDIGVRLYDRYTRPLTGLDVNDGPIVEIERQAAKRIGLRLPFERIASWDHSKL